MKKQKIILFIDSLAGGGAQRQIVTLANHLDSSKYELVLLVYHPIWHYRDNVNVENVRLELVEKKSKFDFLFLFRLIKFIKSEKPDIILSYLNTANMWARVAGKLAGVKTIITSERNIDIVHSRLRVIIEKLLHRFSRYVIVNASATKDLLIKKVGVPESKIKVIYNGVDLDQFEPVKPDQIEDFKRKVDIQPEELVLTLPGRLIPQKNHLCLLKSIEHNNLSERNIKILFVGEEIDINLAESYKNYVIEHGLDHIVKFLGKRNDMNVVYAASDAILLPSLWEGFPNVILESLLLSTPVIASEIADNAQLVIDEYTGFLFESNNDKELSNCILKFIDMSSDEKAKMGLNGFTHIRDKFSKKKLIENYQNLFEIYR